MDVLDRFHSHGRHPVCRIQIGLGQFYLLVHQLLLGNRLTVLDHQLLGGSNQFAFRLSECLLVRASQLLVCQLLGLFAQLLCRLLVAVIKLPRGLIKAVRTKLISFIHQIRRTFSQFSCRVQRLGAVHQSRIKLLVIRVVVFNPLVNVVVIQNRILGTGSRPVYVSRLS